MYCNLSNESSNLLPGGESLHGRYFSLSLSLDDEAVMVNRHSSAERNDGNPLRGTNDVISLRNLDD